MSELIPYFSYGELSHHDIIQAVVGSRPSMQHASLSGYRLGIVHLWNAPLHIRYEILKKWPLNFRCYTIIPEPDYDVRGIVWFLTPEERARVLRWNFSHEGWFVPLAVQTRLSTGERIEATTEYIPKPGVLKQFPDDTDHVPLLNDRTLMLEIAHSYLPPR